MTTYLVARFKAIKLNCYSRHCIAKLGADKRVKFIVTNQIFVKYACHREISRTSPGGISRSFIDDDS